MPTGLNDKVIQWIRTVVPAAVGLALATLGHFLVTKFNWDVDLSGYGVVLAPAIAAACVGAYLALVQWLQKNFSTNKVVKWLLGHPATLAYIKPGDVLIKAGDVPPPTAGVAGTLVQPPVNTTASGAGGGGTVTPGRSGTAVGGTGTSTTNPQQPPTP